MTTRHPAATCIAPTVVLQGSFMYDKALDWISIDGHWYCQRNRRNDLTGSSAIVTHEFGLWCNNGQPRQGNHNYPSFHGYFFLSDGTVVHERGVRLRFKKSGNGCYLVGGAGENMFGRFRLKGMMRSGGNITMLKHYLNHRDQVIPRNVVERNYVRHPAGITLSSPTIIPNDDDVDRANRGGYKTITDSRPALGPPVHSESNDSVPRLKRTENYIISYRATADVPPIPGGSKLSGRDDSMPHVANKPLRMKRTQTYVKCSQGVTETTTFASSPRSSKTSDRDESAYLQVVDKVPSMKRTKKYLFSSRAAVNAKLTYNVPTSPSSTCAVCKNSVEDSKRGIHDGKRETGTEYLGWIAFTALRHSGIQGSNMKDKRSV